MGMGRRVMGSLASIVLAGTVYAADSNSDDTLKMIETKIATADKFLEEIEQSKKPTPTPTPTRKIRQVKGLIAGAYDDLSNKLADPVDAGVELGLLFDRSAELSIEQVKVEINKIYLKAGLTPQIIEFICPTKEKALKWIGYISMRNVAKKDAASRDTLDYLASLEEHCIGQNGITTELLNKWRVKYAK